MSKAVEAAEAKPKPGNGNPDNPKEVWALCTSGSKCPKFPDGRYVTTTTPLKLESAGFVQRCLMCAQRERQLKPETRSGRVRTDEEVVVPSGSAALLGQRSDLVS